MEFVRFGIGPVDKVNADREAGRQEQRVPVPERVPVRASEPVPEPVRASEPVRVPELPSVPELPLRELPRPGPER